MNKTAIELLSYDKIKEQVMEYALSEPGKERIEKMQPSIDLSVIEGWMKETTEARAIIDRNSSVPLHSLKDVEKVIYKLGRGSILMPDDLSLLLSVIEEGKRMKRFMADKSDVAPIVSSYAYSISELNEVQEEIYRCIKNGKIDDKASSELAKIRKKIGVLDSRIKDKLDSILKSNAFRDCIQETLVSMRNGRYVIPVKKEYRKNMNGDVLDSSASGSTVYIEPASIRKLQEDLNDVRIEESSEETRILSCLTQLVESCHREISINIETMVHYDFLFAKARYSKAIDGNPVELNTEKIIDITGARHPLIGRSAVPLDFYIGDGYRALVITGPNTGGKTVALKTVGLLTMMAQSGLHVPVDKGCRLAVFHDILADIGDGQSIEQSLSTFSSHMKNVIGIVEFASEDTLVIVDELGAGTDPAEGTGLAVAVLEEIYQRGATILATTHYSEIKEFAGTHEGFQNGCMEFDVNTLKPLYRLSIGKPGESNAFLIALRLGMEKKIIERAHQITYKEIKEYQEPVKDMETHRIKNDDMLESHEFQKEISKRNREIHKKMEKQKVVPGFKQGDCVYISSLDTTGIVCELENSKGEVGVMVRKKKIKINKKRLSLYIDGKEMYPDNYDFDIVFETKENRKKKHVMGRKHVEGMTMEISKGDIR